MKIAFLTNYFPKLSETFIMNQVTGLLDRGHSVRIFALEAPDDEVSHEIVDEYDLLDRTTYFEAPVSYLSGIVTVARLTATNPCNIQEIISSLKQGTEGGVRLSTLYQFERSDNWNFDVYHAHFGEVGKRWDFLPNQVDAPYIVSFYGHDASKDLSENPERYRRTFDLSDRITVLSEDMREDVVEAGCPEEKTVMQPLPIDVNHFTYSPTIFPEDGPVQLLTVARFTQKKGLDDALEAVDSIDDDYHIKWTIAGDGPLREAFQEEIRGRGLEDRVEVLGWVTQERVHELLENAHLFLLPSKTSESGDKEGTPTVLLEAQASGVPVLSTYHAGIPEIVRDGDTGILVPENDAEQLTTALRDYLSSPEDWEEMGRKGRTFVEETHSKSAVAESLERVYKNP